MRKTIGTAGTEMAGLRRARFLREVDAAVVANRGPQAYPSMGLLNTGMPYGERAQATHEACTRENVHAA